jgi:hypothetical protein
MAKTSERKVLVIDRQRWLRGRDMQDPEEWGGPMLLNHLGKQCCLGFDAVACGIDPAQVEGTYYPARLTSKLWHKGIPLPEGWMETRVLELEPGYFRDTKAVKEAIDANDGFFSKEADREPAVRKALLKLGWDEVEFVN